MKFIFNYRIVIYLKIKITIILIIPISKASKKNYPVNSPFLVHYRRRIKTILARKCRDQNCNYQIQMIYNSEYIFRIMLYTC